MTYATGGVGGTLVDLMDAIRTFGLADGWTIEKWDAPNKLLFMSKGSCAITMKGRTDVTVTIYSGANNSGINTTGNPDHRLYFALNTNNTAALTTYHSHPGSVVTSDYEGDSPWVNGLQGPFVAWHIFSDPAVGDHIHVVVQIKAEHYVHFSFGHVDKRGLTHGGVAYVTAMGATYWRNVSNWTGFAGGAYNNPIYQNYPFAYGNGNSSTGPSASNFQSPAIILKNTNAWPAAWNGPILGASGNASRFFGLTLPLYWGAGYNASPQFPTAGSTSPYLLDDVIRGEATPYSNVVPMYPMPVFRYYFDNLDGTSRRICYVGDFPNVRLINLSNLQVEQEIVLAGDTWKVFPAIRRAPWGDSNFANGVSTGQIGYAYKKVA